jgi:hypothetical protein
VSYDFPDDLLTAQRDLHRVTAELRATYASLPWSVEPSPGWVREDRYRKVEFPDSPGWTDEEKARVAELREELMRLTTLVYVHPYWSTLSGPAVVAARSAIKHAAAPQDEPGTS